MFYPGEPLNGKPTHVFAYYAKPAKGDGPFPAVLLVHGGGGKAFQGVGRALGRARILRAGDGPRRQRRPRAGSTDGGPDQSDETKFRDFDDKTVRDMWTYHAVAAVIRGHNLLAALPEVDKDRVAITGISWGGYLTCIVAGVDDRLKAAVPVYGCGFLHENSAWKESRFDKMTAEQPKRWVETFDPSKYLPGVKCPILFLNGTNDFAYPLDSYQKSLRTGDASRARSRSACGCRTGTSGRSRKWTRSSIQHLKKGDPLPEIGAMTRDGDAVSAKVTSKTKLKAAQLHYAVAEGPWQKREWKSLDAEVKDGVVSAKLPTDRPLVYYLAVTDERGVEVSAPHVVLK